jgi:uncharacterized protein
MKFEIKQAVIPLLIINIGIFIVQLIAGDAFTNAFLLIPKDIFARPWILITHMFLHGGFWHLFFNMYVLFMFGPLLEQKIGPKRFLTVYFLSGIIAGLGYSLVYLIFRPEQGALGASGAIMGMLGALIMVMPDLKLLLFFIIPMPLWVAGIIIALIDFFGLFFPSDIANLAHLFGMAVGLLYGLSLRRRKKQAVKKFNAKTYLEDDDIEEYLKTGRI